MAPRLALCCTLRVTGPPPFPLLLNAGYLSGGDRKVVVMRNLVSISASLATIIAVTPALAEEGPLEEVIVTATRTPVMANQMPTSVSVVDRDFIEARQSFQIADILKDLPGISIARSGGIGGQAQLRMRGAEANHVLVIIDGVKVNDPASTDEFLFEHLSSADIERVEVIRGPQSALWGSDAVSGVINIITKQAGNGTRVSGSVEAGSFDTYRGAARLSVGGEGWNFGADAGYSDSDGTNASRPGNGDADEKDGYRNTNLNATLGLKPGTDINLSLTVRHTDTRNAFDPVDFFVTGLPVDGDRVTDTKRTYLGAKADIAALDKKLNTTLAINWLDSDNRNFADGLADGITAAERLRLSAQTTYRVAKGQRLTAAIEHDVTDFSQRGTASFFGDPNQDQQLKVTGIVADYVGEFTGNFTAFASIRHDDNSDFRNATSWRLGGNYAVSGATRLRASVGTGQKAPTFTERFGFFSDVFIGNHELIPERSTSFEIGIDRDLVDGKATVRLTYFDARLRDEIDSFVFDPDTFLFTAENKDGKSKRRGVEVGVEAEVAENLSLLANYTFTDASEEAPDGSDVRELRRPRHQGAATLIYSSDSGMRASLNASYTGDASDIFFPPWPNPSQIVTLDAYWLIALAGEYPLGEHVALTARIENAFDTDYEDVFGYTNPGRGVYAGLKTRF